MLSVDLLANAVVAGILLGDFYATVAIGLAILFGQLDIFNSSFGYEMMGICFRRVTSERSKLPHRPGAKPRSKASGA